MEEIKGKEFVEFQNDIAFKDLKNTISRLDSSDTKLKLSIGNRNPDDALTDIAYEKGYFFLREIEKVAGREKMDAFLNKYFTEFAFKSITTEDFLLFLDEHLLKENDLYLNTEEWVYSPGLPEGFVLEENEHFKKLDNAILHWVESGNIDAATTSAWSSDEWVYFISNLPDQLSKDQLDNLNSQYHLSRSNADIKYEWFKVAIRNNYSAADGDIEKFLMSMGRLKYVRGLYQALIDNPNGGKEKAQVIYQKARPMYHAFIRDQFDDELLTDLPILDSDSEQL